MSKNQFKIIFKSIYGKNKLFEPNKHRLDLRSKRNLKLFPVKKSWKFQHADKQTMKMVKHRTCRICQSFRAFVKERGCVTAVTWHGNGIRIGILSCHFWPFMVWVNDEGDVDGSWEITSYSIIIRAHSLHFTLAILHHTDPL